MAFAFVGAVADLVAQASGGFQAALGAGGLLEGERCGGAGGEVILGSRLERAYVEGRGESEWEEGEEGEGKGEKW